MEFTYERGRALPPIQVVSISKDDGTPVTNLQTFLFSSGNWLSATSSGANLRISVNPVNLPLGRYGSVILVTRGTASVAVRVLMSVTGPPLLAVNRAHLDFAYASGGPQPNPQLLWVSSTVRYIEFTATTGTSGWLSVSPAKATTLAPLSVSVNPAGLSQGFHTDTITIQSFDATNSPVTVTVTAFIGQ